MAIFLLSIVTRKRVVSPGCNTLFFRLTPKAGLNTCNLLICNEDMQLAGTVVNLYVRFDNITIEDMSQYFKIDNMTAANEGIYADITPIAEYSMEIKHALNNMGVI